MQALLWPIVSWLLRDVVVKFLVLAAVYALLVALVPFAAAFVSPWINTSYISTFFGNLSPSVWFFLDFFRLDIGLPMLISAIISRFLIRRLPIIG